jgi:hypothetical protein
MIKEVYYSYFIILHLNNGRSTVQAGHGSLVRHFTSNLYNFKHFEARSHAYLSIKKPPTKHRTTFGHEYHEYKYTNSDVVRPISLIKLSCRAPGLS